MRLNIPFSRKSWYLLCLTGFLLGILSLSTGCQNEADSNSQKEAFEKEWGDSFEEQTAQAPLLEEYGEDSEQEEALRGQPDFTENFDSGSDAEAAEDSSDNILDSLMADVPEDSESASAGSMADLLKQLENIKGTPEQKAKKRTQTAIDFSFSYKIENGAVTITRYKGLRNKILIPSKINGKPVRKIGRAAFAHNEAIEMVIIPDGVTAIEANAFFECDNLLTIAIPNTVTHIGKNAFTCSWIEEDNNSKASITDIRADLYRGAQGSYSRFKKGKRLFDSTIYAHISSENVVLKYADNFAYLEEDGGATLLGYLGYDPVVTIPASINGLPVQKLGNRYFREGEGGTFPGLGGLFLSGDVGVAFACDEHGIAEVTLEKCPNIPPYAFADCSNLLKVTVLEGCKEIGDYAFNSCHSLTTVEIGEGCKRIGNHAFAATLPGLFGAFSPNKTTALTSITLPESLEKIEKEAFMGCENLTVYSKSREFEFYAKRCGFKFVLLGEKNRGEVKRAGDFEYQTDSESVTITKYTGKESHVAIPDKINGKPVRAIGDSAFKGNTSMVTVSIPQGCKTIAIEAFRGCESLVEAVIPSGCLTIEAMAFRDCKSLAAAIISEGCTTIGPEAFCNCENFVSAAIPQSVTKIGQNAFNNRIAIADSFIRIVNKYSYDTYDDEIRKEEHEMLRVFIYGHKDSCAEEYAKENDHEFISCYENEYIEKAYEGTARAFACESTRYYLPRNGDYFGERESYLAYTIRGYFGTASAIKIPSIIDGKPVIDIEKIKFDGTTIIISDKILSTKQIKRTPEMRICEGVSVIYEGAFENCPNLTSISIPQTVLHIGLKKDNQVLEENDEKQTLGDREKVTVYGTNGSPAEKFAKKHGYRFEGKAPEESDISLLETTLRKHNCIYSIDGNSVTITRYIGTETSLEIPEGVTSIAAYAFVGAHNLESVTIPKSVKSIEKYAFSSCSKLKSVTIHGKGTKIGLNVFHDCDNLTIYGKKGSEAERYTAGEENLKFVEIKSAP